MMHAYVAGIENVLNSPKAKPQIELGMLKMTVMIILKFLAGL
jgi:hypothetical protein